MSRRILAIAESDSSGATGIQADIKTILALGGHAMTAISILTTQNTKGILDIQHVGTSFLAAQIRASIGGFGTDAIKIGLLENEAAINAVADVLDEYKEQRIPIVVDPSIVSRNGQTLVSDSAIAAWKRRLYIHAKILTPNLREAELLSGTSIQNMNDALHTASMMRTLS